MYDFSRKSMIAEDSVSKDLCKSFGSKFDMGSFKFDKLGKSVNNNKNGVIAV